MADRPDATSELKSASGADPPPVETAPFGKVASFASSLNSVILSIFGTIVFVFVIYSVYLGVYDHKLIIRPIIVSKDLIEKGYTPEAVAYHLLSSLSKITNKSHSLFYNGEISEVVVPAKDAPEILVTEKGVSLEAIISGVKYIIGYDNDWIISGDINTSAERQTMTVYIHHDDHTKVIYETFKYNIDLYSRFSTIAEKIINVTDPYLMGVLYLQSNSRIALDIALQIIHNPKSSHQQVSQALLLKSAILRRTGNVDGALEDALEAVSQSPSMPEAHLGLGNALLGKNKKAEALYEYRRAITYDSRFAPGYYNLASLYQDEDDKGEAKRNYRFAIICDPTMYKAYNNLGLLLKDESDLPGAIYQFLTAISLEPNYESAHYNLGSAYFQIGHYADALYEFQTASAIEPDNNAPLISIGKTLFSLGRNAEAEKVFNELIAKKETAELDIDLGTVLEGSGDHEHAIDKYRSAIRLEYANPTAHLNLAVILIEIGLVPDGVNELHYVNLVDASNSKAHYYLALAYNGIGDGDHAVSECKSALDLEPKNTSYQKTLAELSVRWLKR